MILPRRLVQKNWVKKVTILPKNVRTLVGLCLIYSELIVGGENLARKKVCQQETL